MYREFGDKGRPTNSLVALLISLNDMRRSLFPSKGLELIVDAGRHLHELILMHMSGE